MKSRPADHADLQPGDHIAVRRWGMVYAHHGIYIGEGRVIHYTDAGGLASKAHCRVVETSIDAFLGTGKLRIVSHHKPLPGENRIERAKAELDKPGYSLVWNNCEHFASSCSTGKAQSIQVLRVAATLAGGAALFLAGGILKVGSKGRGRPGV